MTIRTSRPDYWLAALSAGIWFLLLCTPRARGAAPAPWRFEIVSLTNEAPSATLNLLWQPETAVRHPVILMLGALDSNAPPAWSTNLLREGLMLCAFSVAHPADAEPARRPQWLFFDERFAHSYPLAAQRAITDTRRVVRHLDTRSDVNLDKLGWFGSSSTGIPGLAVATQGPRLAAIVAFVSTGAYRAWLDTWRPNGLWRGGTNGWWPETERLLTTVDPLLHADKLWPTATLLVNGGEDKVVDIRAARAFVEAARPAFTNDPSRLRLVNYEGFGHNLPIDVVRDYAERWFLTYLHPTRPPPGPPGKVNSLAESARQTQLNAASHASIVGAEEVTNPPLALGSRLELFTDGQLIGQLKNCTLKLHEPHVANVALRFDAPWEGAFSGYVTVLQDGERFCCYYRGNPVAGRDGSETEVTCYAESRDGITFVKPALGLCAVDGSKSNNVVLAGQAPFSHNFAPFLDARPEVRREERFKALAGTSTSGLFGFVSADGLRWNKMREKPLLTQGAFDSQNVAFWSASEQRYVLYLRTWSGGGFRDFRTISRSTSTNFFDWTRPVEMTFGDTPREHLYTSQTHPYFRAPHIYIATPMRFVPGRKVLTAEQARVLGVEPGYASDTAETVLMTSRGGESYTRTFLEGFIRPGPDLGNWASRAGLTALGIVPTGPAEMSLYKQAHYAQASSHLVRYSMRTDGFVSVHAPFGGGEFLTQPLTFAGHELVLNFSTGAAGSLRVELQSLAGGPLPGFALKEADEQVGDEIERRVTWKAGHDLSRLAGQIVRLRFVMQDADLYSIRFR